MSHSHPPAPRTRHIVIVPVVVAVILTLFAWPQSDLRPRGLPIAVAAGPGTTAIEQRLHHADAFAVHHYTTAAAAREAVEDRRVYAAVVQEGTRVSLVTASAGSPAVAAQLTEAFSADAPGAPVRAEDVVPADPDDPRGAAFNASVLPLLIAGLLTGLLVASMAPPGWRQVGLLGTGAALAGGAAIAVAQGWLGILGDGWAASAAVLAFMVLAIASLVVGLHSTLGHRGVGLAALLIVFMGNPWSGLATAPEMLPRPLGDLGQLLPPGAGGQALRSVAFFDGAGAASHLLVLTAWTIVGMALIAASARTRARRVAAVIPVAA